MPDKPNISGERPKVVLFARLVAFVFFSGIGWVALNLEQSGPETILVCLLGAILGWGLGIIATPLSAPDSGRFTRIAQTLSAFASGYVVSKLDRFLEATLFAPEGGAVVGAAWTLLALFAASMATMATLVFMNRSYDHGAERLDVG